MTQIWQINPDKKSVKISTISVISVLCMKNEELKMKNKELTVDNGELTMTDWEEKFLVKVAKFRPRKSKVKDLSELKCSFVPMKDLNEKRIEFEPKEERSIGDVYKGYTYFQDNDVLLAKVTPCFQNRKAGVAKGLTNGIGFGSSEFFVFRPSENILPEFIYYFFMTENFINNGVANMSGAVGLKRVSNDYIKNVKIPLPPIPEQRRIVSKLDALFAEIDASLALIDQNIEQAEALKLSVLDEEFSMDNEGVKISRLIKKTENLKPKKEFPDEQFTYLDISSVNKDKKVIEEPKILKGKEAPSRAKREVLKGDVLFATTRPNLKNIAVVENDYDKPIASTGFCLLRTMPDKLFNRYLFYFLLTNTLQDLIEPFIRGAQYPAISDRNLKGLKIPLPNLKTQQKIVQKLDALFGEIDALVNDYTQKRENLEALKSSLLDQAFKGKL